MRTFSLLGFIALGAAVSACEPPIPATPTYAKDVSPILAAHCVRCHGAGGTLNPEPTNPLGVPGICYLNFYDDMGDCTLDPTNCKHGAKFCAAYLPAIFETMPPPPAQLNDWEKEVLTAWKNTGAMP